MFASPSTVSVMTNPQNPKHMRPTAICCAAAAFRSTPWTFRRLRVWAGPRSPSRPSKHVSPQPLQQLHLGNPAAVCRLTSRSCKRSAAQAPYLVWQDLNCFPPCSCGWAADGQGRALHSKRGRQRHQQQSAPAAGLLHQHRRLHCRLRQLRRCRRNSDSYTFYSQQCNLNIYSYTRMIHQYIAGFTIESSGSGGAGATVSIVAK